MNVLLLGNGFDINYCLPTKYINFLHTVAYLGKLESKAPATVGDVFRAPELQSVDEDIKRSYQSYWCYYNEVELEDDAVEQLRRVAHRNIWFGYLSELVDKDIGWIDFEKEIGCVLDVFEAFLKTARTFYVYDEWSKELVACEILERFNFFAIAKESLYSKKSRYIKEEFVSKNPIVEKIEYKDNEKIVKYLEKYLYEFADALKVYLRCFVDNVVSAMSLHGILPAIKAFDFTDTVVTFNYTQTFEHLYDPVEVFHIHGDINSQIVLGLNPSEADYIGSIDTTFLAFKKYYQRAVYHSEDGYLSWLTKRNEAKRNETIRKEAEGDISLLVMGHSLDETDKDILVELFDVVNSITILYHDDSSQRSLTTNLVKMYGRDGFHELRTKKKLRFLSLWDDFTEFLEEREKTHKTAATRFANNWMC